MEVGKLLVGFPVGSDQWDWECLCDELTDLIAERNPDGYWRAEVHNFGWRGQDGQAKVVATTGSKFLQAILPQTDCAFKVFEYGEDGFAINNFHHDSPYGAEWYYVVPPEICASCDEDLDDSGHSPITYQSQQFCCWACVADWIQFAYQQGRG